MEYKNDELGARLVVPDKITVRQQLAYLSESTYRVDADRLEKSWAAARGLITEWECPAVSLDAVDLEKETDPTVTKVILWSILEVQKHMNNLENIPKN